jgi:hypothetical protein
LLWTSFKKQDKKAGLKLRLNSLVDVKNISPSELLKQALYKNKQDFPVRFIFFLQYNLNKKILSYHCKKRLLIKLSEY